MKYVLRLASAHDQEKHCGVEKVHFKLLVDARELHFNLYSGGQFKPKDVVRYQNE